MRKIEMLNEIKTKTNIITKTKVDNKYIYEAYFLMPQTTIKSEPRKTEYYALLSLYKKTKQQKRIF